MKADVQSARRLVLEPDREQLATFFDALFKYAYPTTWISLRSFYEDRDELYKKHCVRVGDHEAVIEQAYRLARECARVKRKVVFAPPVATFNNDKTARKEDVVDGVALDAEIDKSPQAARATLEGLLGPSTVVVESGGEWTNPETDEVEPKLHLHWRLKKPARGAELALLEEARKIVIDIGGSDPSHGPISHPIRWPGSWHRKGDPKLCRIVAVNPEREIDLHAALAALKKAAPAKSRVANEPGFSGETSSNNWLELITAVLTAESYHDPLIRLASKLLATGMHDGAAVNLLRAWMETSAGPRDARWQRRYNDIPRGISTAREKFGGQESEAPAVDEHPRQWPVLAPEALHGLAGEVVELIGPHTEADPVALLLQFLVSFGNAIDRGHYYQVEGDKHYCNLFAVQVGETGKSRKGTSAGRIRQLMETVCPIWADECIKGGLSSGEGVVAAIQDKIVKTDKNGNEEVIVKGVDDKRLLLDEREFFSALVVMKREGNIVSRIVRDAWDSIKVLGTLTKNSQTRATKPHISINGHITEEELQRTLDHTSMANGYANRFLFACVRRARELPFGGSLEQSTIDKLGAKIKEVYLKSHMISKQITMNAEAKKLWVKVYHDLSMGQPGLLGAITGRAEAQTVRLALLYAVLDGSNQIKRPHLRAALALWQYCEDSARYIFGDSLGDPLADQLLRALRDAGGMSRTQIHNLFKRNQPAEKIEAALAVLVKHGKVRREMRTEKGKRGRPEEFWALK